ncbi:MAG: nickel and cobalt resistance protein CnrR [Verrucomicrobiota bacterium]|jgi:hypothetical protein
MKRPWFILVGGLLLALIAYGASYHFASSNSSCCLLSKPMPELAWLQTEFHLSNEEFARIQKLHETYQSGCAERCAKIDAKNAELTKLLAQTNTVSPEIENALQEAAQLRTACQKTMLEHFYAVSQTMPPAQGKRYLAWVTERTLGSEHNSMTHDSPAATHEHHAE